MRSVVALENVAPHDGVRFDVPGEIAARAYAGTRDVFVLALKPGLIVERTLQQTIVGVPERERAGPRGAGPGDQIAAKNADRPVLLRCERRRDRQHEYRAQSPVPRNI